MWTADPKNEVFGQASKRALPASGIGKVGEKAATAIADFIVVDMFANYCTGAKDAKGADGGSRAAVEAHLSLMNVRTGGGDPPPVPTLLPGQAGHRPDTAGNWPMADIATRNRRTAKAQIREATAWDQLKDNRNWLGFWFMLPAMAFLILFLAYPLGPRHLAFLHRRQDRPRRRSSSDLENYEWLWDDSIFWLSVFNTLLYTFVASAIKFAIGLYLALLLNENMPFKAMLRALVLIPFIVPTVLSALAFWWIFDSQFSIISWSLKQLGLINYNINFLGDTTWARICVIFANIWRGVPFVAITLLAGLQTVSPSLYEAATLDGATRWQMFRHITYPLLTPIIAVVMTFSVLFTFTDFQLIWAMTRGGPVNATHLMATLSYQRAIIAGQLGEGAAISNAMIPFLLAAIMVSWFGLQRRKWQQGENND